MWVEGHTELGWSIFISRATSSSCTYLGGLRTRTAIGWNWLQSLLNSLDLCNLVNESEHKIGQGGNIQTMKSENTMSQDFFLFTSVCLSACQWILTSPILKSSKLEQVLAIPGDFFFFFMTKYRFLASIQNLMHYTLYCWSGLCTLKEEKKKKVHKTAMQNQNSHFERIYENKKYIPKGH